MRLILSKWPVSAKATQRELFGNGVSSGQLNRTDVTPAWQPLLADNPSCAGAFLRAGHHVDKARAAALPSLSTPDEHHR